MYDPRFAGYVQLLLFLAFVIPAIFFLLTQQRTLELIRPGNRRINPRQVWLQLIPLFGVACQFYIIISISNSIRDEMNTPIDDSLFDEGSFLKYRPTYNAGILYAGFICFSFIPFPLLKGLFALAGMCTWIIYWVQLSRYKKQLKQRASLSNF
jgi:hypothetical protein